MARILLKFARPEQTSTACDKMGIFFWLTGPFNHRYVFNLWFHLSVRKKTFITVLLFTFNDKYLPICILAFAITRVTASSWIESAFFPFIKGGMTNDAFFGTNKSFIVKPRSAKTLSFSSKCSKKPEKKTFFFLNQIWPVSISFYIPESFVIA